MDVYVACNNHVTNDYWRLHELIIYFGVFSNCMHVQPSIELGGNHLRCTYY